LKALNITEALDIFDIDLGNIDDDKLKKKYRLLMKANHPDLGGSHEKAQSIIEAYELIKKAMKTLKVANAGKVASDNSIYIITLGQLIDIYSGKSFKSQRKQGLVIDIKSLRKLNIMVSIEVIIEVDGVKSEVSVIAPYNSNDIYDINYNLEVPDITVNKEAIIKCLDKNIKLLIDNDKNLRLTFKNNIGINVHITKVVIDSGRKEH
jgi:curved DNA-binding protein CbpA